MRLSFFILFITVIASLHAQDKYILATEMFEWKAGIEKLDTIQNYNTWQANKTTYENGRKKEEFRIFITEGCAVNNEADCNIKYQHQKYYDDSISTLMMKEGKYMFIKKGKGVYKSYYWDYNHKGKLLSKERSKTNISNLLSD